MTIADGTVVVMYAFVPVARPKYGTTLMVGGMMQTDLQPQNVPMFVLPRGSLPTDSGLLGLMLEVGLDIPAERYRPLGTAHEAGQMPIQFYSVELHGNEIMGFSTGRPRIDPELMNKIGEGEMRSPLATRILTSVGFKREDEIETRSMIDLAGLRLLRRSLLKRGAITV